MLVSRIYKPKEGTLLYHYCSVETLAAIAEHKCIRFSDVNMMNDYYETGYAYGLFEETANEILKDAEIQKKLPGMTESFFDQVDQVISPSQLFLHPVIACFSKSPDVLSQWRGYADDARGVAVGFPAELLGKMPVTVLEVEYKRSVQIAEMKAALVALYMMEIDRGATWGNEFRNDCMVLAAWSLGFKSEAFQEEQEVRLLHVLTAEFDGDRSRLVDVDETDKSGAVTKGQPVRFRVADGALIAYIDIPIPATPDGKFLPEVWVGPRNMNGPGNLLYLLGGNGVSGATLRRSTATFR